MWHVTRDKWHVTHDRCGEVKLLSKFQLPSSYGLGVKVFWRYFHKGWVRENCSNWSQYFCSGLFAMQCTVHNFFGAKRRCKHIWRRSPLTNKLTKVVVGQPQLHRVWQLYHVWRKECLQNVYTILFILKISSIIMSSLIQFCCLPFLFSDLPVPASNMHAI